VEGWEYSVDPWPGRVVREMSPLSSIDDDEIELLEREIAVYHRELEKEERSAKSQGESQVGKRGFHGRRRTVR